HGQPFLRVEGVFEREGERSKVVVKLAAGQRKEIERNGVAFSRIADYVGQYPVVMIAPEDVALVQDGSEERRRFLDATLSQISGEYLYSLLTYNALLKQRNALLKSFAEGGAPFDAALLEGIDRQMPAPAQLLQERRSQFVEQFRPLFLEYYAAISGGHESVDVGFVSDLSGAGLLDLFAAVRERDRALGRSTRGPQRDDLRLDMDGQPVRRFASQGQLKSFLLALRLAQYEVLRREKDTAPILLLDDIFDKLDERRVRQLVGLLLERDFGQIFITDTQRSRMEAIVSSFTGEYRLFEVEEGRVEGV
ncbi:MAG TPA: DNA replication and repair protein RecF, partial [Saprospiraceae bacterium]|nr:DNA replication and repair protein RecF [Saprospiraceae bacterium]